MTNPKSWHNFHVFRKNDELNMQKHFVFVDTEANIRKEGNTQYQTFQLGTAIYWDHEHDHIERLTFYDVKPFWDMVEDKAIEHGKIICYAHNMGYDIRLLDGIKELEARGWTCSKHYVKNKVFMLEYRKEKARLCLWDTYNYVPYSLAEIGKTLGLKKQGTFTDHKTKEELASYCMNDTEIIYRFIRGLIEFLEKYELTKLMPTVASLSLNTFRHHFYNPKKKPIYIHDWKQAIQLERESYMGGINDCLKVGKINETVYKLDINSMYPSIMLEKKVPTKLIYYSCQKSDDLKKIYDSFKHDHIIIARCKVKIPEKYAYILSKMTVGSEEKAILAFGSMELVKCSPELAFIEKYGKIEAISEIAVYESDPIFKDFISFFYERRLEYKAKKDQVNEQFCKLMLNSLYGKWGQKDIVTHEYTEKDDIWHEYQMLKEAKEANGEVLTGIYIGDNGKKYNFMELGNRLFSIDPSEENSKDSFVAISSAITSYARVQLVEYILQAGRENVFYMDTDSLFVNKTGFERLSDRIDPTKLGYLKLEATANEVTINKPKDYQFGPDRKLKGVRKDSKIIRTDDEKDVYIQDRWEGFTSAMKKGHHNVVVIQQYEKQVSKVYDKGRILKDGRIKPFRKGK